ncbi:MAG: ABC transporter permease [Thermaceae bacterium]|nr:ABC transporter permease [Thermaceae bacterium]
MTLRRSLEPLLRNPLGLLGLILSLLVVGAALLGPALSPFAPDRQDILARLSGPSAAHWLGTDQFGRDIFSRILYGFRSSLEVAFASVGLALLIGAPLGILAAYRGGWLDRIILRLMDVLLAFPIILLAIGIVAMLGPSQWNAALAIGIVYVPIFVRLTRGPALVLRASDYIQAAQALGAGASRVVFRHILPNLASVILVQTTLALSTAVLVESSLAFLGLGTQPPNPSLGQMLAEGRAYMTLSPWTSLFSGLAILLASLGFNLLGDSLRDTLDPRLRGH